MKKKRWPWLVGVAVLVVTAGGLARRGAGGTKEIDSSLVVSVKRGELAIDVIETGKVQPREKVEIKSKVPGQALQVLVDAGARVKEGELLIKLDPTDYRRDVAKCDADVAQAKNALEFAQLSLDRRKRGLEARGVSQADVDFAINDLKSKQVAVRTADVALGAAQDRLRYTQITSPMNGTVIERGIQPGEVVTPGVQATFEGKALLTVADLSTLVVKADLNQIDIAKVAMGQKVTLTLDALPGKTYEATVTKVAPASILPKGKDVDVFPVEATLIKSDGLIKPGMTTDVRVHVDKKQSVLALPIEAVVKDGGKSYVTRIVESGKGSQHTEKIEVQVGARNDREIEISAGIAEGDRVLIKPNAAQNEYKL